MTEYTDQERDTIRTAAFGAMTLVSAADPGFFAMFKESLAASKALAGSSGVVKEALTKGGIPSLPKSSVADVEATVLPALTQSMTILSSKAPAEADSYRATILEACDKVAAAAGGVAEKETAEIAKIRAALG
ncbi:MAG TPA: hypothetical protein DGG94_00300 [Micromonosporaceae bacterium]|nr:hypothetical protein [Micromonosporaceae bacterium]